MKLFFVSFFLVLLLSMSGTAQLLDLKSLDSLSAKASESSDINLDGATLQAASQFLTSQNGGDDGLKKLLAGLIAVKVKSFEFEKKGQYTEADLQPIRTQLQGSGWSRIVDVKEKTESSQIYLRTGSNGQINGMVIISAEPRELNVVQIMGKVSPQDLTLLNGLPQMKLEMPHKKKEN